MNSASCSIVGLRKTGAVSRMKSFQNCPGASSTSGGGPSRISRSSKPRASSVPANDSSTMNTTRWPRALQLLADADAVVGRAEGALREEHDRLCAHIAPLVEYCDGGAGPLWPHPAVSSRMSPDQTAAAAERACA